jgi:hypothetical protein
MKSIAVTFILLGAFTLVQDLFFEPTVNDGRKILEKYVERASQGNMRLAAFQTGGISGRSGGFLEMSFEGSVECTGEDSTSSPSAVAFTFDRAYLRDVKPMLRGEHRYVKGVIRFDKARFGWVGKPM